MGLSRPPNPAPSLPTPPLLRRLKSNPAPSLPTPPPPTPYFPLPPFLANPNLGLADGSAHTEVLMLERLSHPNLVSLRGYCAHGEMAFLVYEYVSKGALNYHLFSTADNVIPLSWQQRVQIAVGAATGLHHLHERNIIHRDFKSSNILLDDNLVAKVSDFGLAKVGPVGDQSYVETKVKGTPGYIDPAYMERGWLTWKSDVYAFGVVLLELLLLTVIV
ncbi:unnamed protein product [Closterium sp. Naga37s-1]|nr:unnamed protein product [Closterium sp. Naga37s-1]